VHREKEKRWIADGPRFSSVARSFPQTACLNHGNRLQAVCIPYSTGSWFLIAKDVPVLRVNHIAGEVVVPGVRKVARSCDKIDDCSGTLIVGDAQRAKEINMLWTIFVVLLILWVLGFSLHVAGGLIHLLLVVALVILVINLVSGRRVA
jgi:hypothetical protein